MCTTTTGCTAFTVHTGGDEAGLCELFQDCASQPASNVITGFTFVANSNAKTCTTSTGIGTCYDWDGTQTGSVTAVTSTDCGVGKRPGEAAVASSFLFAATIPSSGTATAFCENTPCSGANDIAACCNDILCSDKDGSGGGAVTDSECQAGESGGSIYRYNAANANSACSGGSAGATTCDVSTVGAVDHSICCISILCTAASGHVSVIITTGSSLYACKFFGLHSRVRLWLRECIAEPNRLHYSWPALHLHPMHSVGLHKSGRFLRQCRQWCLHPVKRRDSCHHRDSA